MRYLYQLLMDDGNTVVPCIIHVADTDLFSVDIDLALLGDIDAAQHLDQSGFSRAVFPEQRVNLAGQQLKIHILQRLDARKFLGDMFHFKQILAQWVSPPFLAMDLNLLPKIGYPERGFALGENKAPCYRTVPFLSAQLRENRILSCTPKA